MGMHIEVPIGLEGVVVATTAISDIDGERGVLSYRGVDIGEVVQRFARWEDLLPWLIYGRENLSLEPPEQGDSAGPRMTTSAPMARLIQVILDRGDAWPAGDPAAEMTWLSEIPERFSGWTNETPDQDLSVAGRYLTAMRSGKKPTGAEERALNAYWVMAAEHGLNASTFAVRVAASTGTTLPMALSAGVATLAGPLHGGAPEGVLSLLKEVRGVPDLEAMLTEKVHAGERLMGFGHRVYRTRDPRATALKAAFVQLAEEHELVEEAIRLEEAALRVLARSKPDRVLATNVEFYAAVLLAALEIPSDLCPATFACARLAGWTAHYHEQRARGRLIRPMSVYRRE